LPNIEAIVRKAISDTVANQLATSVEREVAQQIEKTLVPKVTRNIVDALNPVSFPTLSR
jgi:hypothetical protein